MAKIEIGNKMAAHAYIYRTPMKNSEMRQQLVQLGNGAHALATQILGNADEAQDAVHDSFLKVFSRPHAYQAGYGPLAPWFLRLVRNHCIDLIRRRKPQDGDLDALVDPMPGPEKTLQIAQRDNELRRALEKLSDAQRQIIVLKDYMDMNYAEIAQVLEIAPGTVMSRLHRSRMALKEELERHG
ncbi:MAG: RNA polymerase sigma-70 factor (ECF subfamily) [Lysobacterales bacterium]|jgi:RNA polymerase sigma-70 factor (ECF subfamily)